MTPTQYRAANRSKQMTYAIEIQATNKTWFADDELPVTADPVKADDRIAELRKQGFNVRARMTESMESER